ncbi:PREDICTED: uncharacterized protein LOC109182593 [Ipomoea nil]|uniref:uncharacterized protein LOC109182593 n=1 Tax=Ipomoea nil TaxID=35883 RepID=UPI000901FEE2|nr:PREDICTED: uncharacterized protein LOC109182593 [Ipomoea nil]
MDVAAVTLPATSSPEVEGEAGKSQPTHKRVKILKRSFAEAAVDSALMGDDPMSEKVDEDWLEDGSVIELEETKNVIYEGVPVVKIPKELRAELERPWHKALILKFLGKPPAFMLLQQRLLRLWNRSGKVELLDVGMGFYMARFDLASDYRHVLLDGPWKLFDCYIIPQRWRRNFDPQTAKLESMVVWVRMLGLPVELFREDVIKKILEPVGKTIKVDKTTAGIERVRFARAAVEIDLRKPLGSMVVVDEVFQKVSFEGLHTICFG